MTAACTNLRPPGASLGDKERWDGDERLHCRSLTGEGHAAVQCKGHVGVKLNDKVVLEKPDYDFNLARLVQRQRWCDC